MVGLVVAVMIAHRLGRHHTIAEDPVQFVEEDGREAGGILHGTSVEIIVETISRGHPPILSRGLTLSANSRSRS